MLSLGPRYQRIIILLESTSTMVGMKLHTWFDCQLLLEGQKLSKNVELWGGKCFNNSQMFCYMDQAF
jgi:hypothetical protein